MKKTLLIAAAALVAGVISSEAQTVYSVNVVGYASVVLAPGYTLICNPFDDGKGNQISNILASANLVNKSQVLTWNAGLQTYDTAIGKVNNDATSWGGPFPVSVGQGFFLKNNGVATSFVQILPAP